MNLRKNMKRIPIRKTPQIRFSICSSSVISVKYKKNMSKEVKIPKLSEETDTGTVASIYVKEGDTVEEGQDIIGLESDKASMDVPSDSSGTVKSIKVKEGDEVKVGDVILTLEESGDGEEKEDKPDDEGSSQDKEEETDESVEKEKTTAGKKKKDEEEKEEEDSGSDEPDEKEDPDEEDKKPKKEKEKESDDDSEDDDTDEKGRDDKEEDDDEEEKDVDEDSEEKEEKKKPAKKSEAKDSAEEEDESEEKSATAPLAKKFARELGIDIKDLQGDDPEKRITREDVMAHAKKLITERKKDGGEPSVGNGVEPIELPDFSQWGDTEREPLSGIRSAIARNTTLSWQNIPHVTHHDKADLTELHEFLSKTAEEDGQKLSMTAVLTKIAVEALKQFPVFNASLDLSNKEIIFKKYYHVSVAVDTENGLLMPVLKDVDQKSLNKLSQELSDLAEKARSQKLKPEEMKGGNFAISNLGGIGGTSFTPVIFPPQGAILGVSTSQTRAIFIDGEFKPREILPLSLSYDHRLIDGAEAARFLRWICEVIEQPFNLLTRS